MQSVEALLSASLRVSRPVAACSRCRMAKIKCDGKLPACTACERSGKAQDCSGTNDEFAKGKERSYVGALETTLAKLQKRAAQLNALQTSDPISRDETADGAILGPGSHLSRPNTIGHTRLNRKEASDIDNLVGDFGFLCVNATSRDFHGFTSTMSFARLLLSASKTAELSKAETMSLPPRYTVNSLVQSYLEDVFVLMPFFSETVLMSSVTAIYSQTGRHAKPIDHWMVRMVLAIAFAGASPEKGDELSRIAQNHVSAALTYAEDVLHPGSISGVQAILLLVQYSMVDPDAFSSWHLIGFASRVMVDLGLHQEPAPEFTITKAAIDTRRRVFYCVYTFDRHVSMALGRPFSFTDDSVSVSLPEVGHSSTQKDSGQHVFLRSIEPCLYLFDIRRIQSALYQETRMSNRTSWPASTAMQYTQLVLADLTSWFSNIPESLSPTKINLFRLELLYSQIVALAPSCRLPRISEHSQTLIFRYAVEYVDHLHPITCNNSWIPFFTCTDARRLCFVGRQFVSVVWSNLDYLFFSAMPQESPAASPISSGSITQPQRSSTSPPLHPPTRSRPASQLENLRRAMYCLTRSLDILSYARRRFGNSAAGLHTEFEGESAMLMEKLRMKQGELNLVSYNPHEPVRAISMQPHSVTGPESNMPITPPIQEALPLGYQQPFLPTPSPRWYQKAAQTNNQPARPQLTNQGSSQLARYSSSESQ